MTDTPDNPDDRSGDAWPDPVEQAWADPAVVDFFARDAVPAGGADVELAPIGDTMAGAVAVATEQEIFAEEVDAHDRGEHRLLWKEVGSITFVVVVIVIRHYWLV